jgi:hypothetical protein
VVTKHIGRSVALAALLLTGSSAYCQEKPAAKPPTAKQTTAKPVASSSAANKEQNIKAYIKLLREDVRSAKSGVMSEVMQFDPDEAAKFWPVYRDYEAELSKLNDMRIANIEAYARDYATLTDKQADDAMREAVAFQKARIELLAKYYDRVKQEMGAVTAARFIQVEHQLLLIVDLQLESSLPVAGSR